ncbi:class I SAM-dependent DNA methyltransferase [Streptomyces albidoflavus]
MAKPLALNEIRKRAGKFLRDWKDSPGDERQDAQSFVRDLLAVYGVTETRAAFYEKRVRRASTGQQGYIDALVPGLALIEMKSAGKDLEAAEQQALDYVAGLTEAEAPRWLLTSDFKRFRLLDLNAEEGQDTTEWTLADFPANSERLAFFAGYGVRQFGSKDQEAASIGAAQLMAELYEALEGSGYDDHEASVFLVRTLFALYADDAGVWERDLFLEFLTTRTAEDGSDLGQNLALLYQVMATPPERRQRNLDELVARFPYVNGGVFEGPLNIPAFDVDMRGKLLKAAMYNWSSISPAVFGSLFQAVKNKKARRELGEHYTTESNILKVIGPMFMDDLHQRFADHQHDARKLNELRRDMGRMRFLDPACGCGNFLVVAYREMRALDLRVLERLQQLHLAGKGASQGTMFFSESDLPVGLENFHGIELEDWPARIAATALHLVEHQANQAMELALGRGPEPLPLNKIHTIHVGNALRTDWTTIVEPGDYLYVLGNPPFLGHKTRDVGQAADLRMTWRRDDIGRLDYVTGWYAKALDLFSRPGYEGEFAFVSTNSITQGEPVPALFGPVFEKGWRIKFAHRTFAWTSEAPEAAAVYCVILGFDRRPRRPARIFDYAGNLRGAGTELPVTDRINAYLIDGPNILVEQRREPLSPGLPPASMGSMPRDGGNLIVTPDSYAEVAADPVAAKYLRRYVMGKELINNLPRWCLWLVDLDPSDVRRSPVLRKRLEAVRVFRSKSSAASTRQMADTPHLFGQRSQPLVPYLGIPKVFTENRRWVTCDRLMPDVIAGDKVYKCEDPDGFAFAVISSSAFIAWQKAIGGRLKYDPSFSNTLTWNNFPLPAVTAEQRQAIIAGGQAVLSARELHPGRSLADHYNPLAMDPALIKAHRTLDQAVDAVLGLKGSPNNDDRLKALFSAYTKLTSAGQLPVPRARARRRITK